MAKTKIIHVAVEPKMAKELGRVSEERDLPVSSVIREAVKFWLDMWNKGKP